MLSGQPPRSVGVKDCPHWPRVHEAIHRGGEFVIETRRPEFTAILHFWPEQPDKGHYEIRYHPARRPVERGITKKVTAVSADEADSRLSMLKPYATRYAVITVGSERPHSKMAWRIGLTNFRSVDEADLEDDANPSEGQGT
jgi:hypothetical protein